MTIEREELDDKAWPKNKEYLVRQYRPAYFSGFETEHFRAATRDEITAAPWLKNFSQEGLDGFVVAPYASDELIVVANYKNGEHWVSAFAIPADSKWANNWRYGGPKGGVET